ncbi:group I truncated hemoglobin [Lacisediminihabitans sp. FW035]
MNLYDEIGGSSAVTAVVEDYWRRVSADEILAPWFSTIDSRQLNFHLRAYLTVALGGPEEYEGRSMRHAHAGLSVTGTAFDLLVTRLNESLLAVGATPESIVKVDARLTLLRPVIVEREA